MLPLRTHMNAKSRNRGYIPVTAQIRRLYLFIVIKMSTHIAGSAHISPRTDTVYASGIFQVLNAPHTACFIKY